MLGKHCTEETKRKMSLSQKGKTLSEETKKKISLTMKGRIYSPETRKKMSEKCKAWNREHTHPFLGKHHTKEAKAKIGEANRGRKPSLESRKKMSETHKGKKVSAKTKKKMSELHKGAKNLWWKGGRTVNKDGYVLIYMPDHPCAFSGKYILEHRYVMEQQLGRYLESWENVHHKNGVRDDNRPENLEIVVRKNHFGQVRCPHCLESFSIK